MECWVDIEDFLEANIVGRVLCRKDAVYKTKKDCLQLVYVKYVQRKEKSNNRCLFFWEVISGGQPIKGQGFVSLPRWLLGDAHAPAR
jgi:hypothetical protein